MNETVEDLWIKRFAITIVSAELC